MKKICFLLLSLCMLVGCKKESSSNNSTLSKFEFSDEEYITEEMGAFWIEDELEIEPEELKDAVLEDIVWTSENESIVKVSNGRAFGLYEGETTIMATAPSYNKAASCRVKVKYAPITSFELEAPEKTYAGNDINITVKSITPSNASPRHLTWESTAEYEGQDVLPTFDTEKQCWILNTRYTGIVTLFAKAGEVQKSITLNLKENKVTGILLNGKDEDPVVLNIAPGHTISYDYQLIVEDKDYLPLYDMVELKSVGGPVKEKLSWDSYAKTITGIENVIGILQANLVEDGTLRPLGKTFRVIVSDAVPVTNFDLDKTSIDMKIGEEAELTPVNITPANGTASLISWSSSNPQLVTISNRGESVTLNAVGTTAGTATITAQYVSITKTCTVSVTPVNVVSVQINGGNDLTLWSGTTGFYLNPVITPSNATNKGITYSLDKINTNNGSTSRSYDAFVNENGYLTVNADASGSYWLYATADGRSTRIKLYVIPRNFTPNMPDTYYGTFGMKVYLIDEGWKKAPTAYYYAYPQRTITNVTRVQQVNGNAADIRDGVLWYRRTIKIGKDDVNSRVSSRYSFKYNITDDNGVTQSYDMTIAVVNTFEGVYVGSYSAGVDNAKDTDYTWTIPSGTNSTNVYLYYYCKKNGNDAHDSYYEHKDLRYEKPNPLKVCETAASTMGTTAREIKVKY